MGGGKNLTKELEILTYLAKKHYTIPYRFAGYTDRVCPGDDKNLRSVALTHLKHAFRGNHQEEFLKEINNIAKENNHNLYVIVLPRAPKYREILKEVAIEKGFNYSEIFSPLDRIAKECNLKVINHFEDNNFTNEDFSDANHLVPAGALKYTCMLMSEI